MTRLRLLILFMMLPLLMGAANLTWVQVTTDVLDFPITVSAYRLYERPFGSTVSFVFLGETPVCCVFDLPSASAKMEYVATAVDVLGLEGAQSIPATAMPDAPGQLKVNRGTP